MEWQDIFNKGVPVDKGLGFTVDLIGKNCATDAKGFIKTVTDEMEELNHLIEKYTKVPLTVKKGLFAVSIFDDLNQTLAFSSQAYIISIMSDLNCAPQVYSAMYGDQLRAETRKRLHDLNRVKTVTQLEKEFPELYEIYVSVEKMYNDMIEMRKKYAVAKKMNIVNDEVYNRNLAAYKKYLGEYGLDKKPVNIRNFVEEMHKRYSYLIKPEVYSQVIRTIEDTPIDLSKFDKCLDKEKFELLMAVSSLETAKCFEDEAIAHISYLAQYFREHENDMDSDVSVTLYSVDGDEVFTRISLYKQYKEFLIQHPEVKIVRKTKEDFEGQSIEDIKAYLKTFSNELEVSWDILPSGESLFERTRYEGVTSSITDEERKQKEVNKERILQEKEDFFNKNKPYLILRGKNSFVGYVGYIYPNAYVVLEKFFKNAKNTTIAEDAIYIMKVEEFLDLSIKSKPEIIENHLCQRVTHHRGWQGKVEDILKNAITEDTIERVQIFENQIKSLKN